METKQNPVLLNYVRYTFLRLDEEGKVSESEDGEYSCFNTGLVTEAQEPIFGFFKKNAKGPEPWRFSGWRRKGEHDLTVFTELPDLASYYDDPSCLVYDCRKDLRVNVEHVIVENKDRFPDQFRSLATFALQTQLRGAVDNAKERVRRNYKAAIPQYYQGKIQLLLPLCLSKPKEADLAIVVEDYGAFYRATTCLTLDMAYNNARQLARPDRDWLQP